MNSPVMRQTVAWTASDDSAASMHASCARLLSGSDADPAVDASALAACAGQEGIAGLLLELPAFQDPAYAPQRAALQVVARQAAMRELAGTAQTRQILSLLAQAGIEVLVLKGSALACWLYREPWHRPHCDLDLLVADITVARRAVAVLQHAGFALVAGVGPDAADGYEVALQKGDGIVIDLHWRLLNHAVLARAFGFPELHEASQPLPSMHPQARGLGPLHALFHALLHRVTNLAKGEGDRLIWLYDIHLLAGRCEADDWRAFVDLCAQRGIATPCRDGLQATARTLSTLIPQDMDEALARLAQGETWQLLDPDHGVMDRAHLTALKWAQKLGWMRRKLFPSREFMRYRYGAAGSVALARVYIHRWWVGVRRALGGR